MGFYFTKSNYINISNLGSLVIFIENDTTLLIFLNRNYDGVEKLNCNIEKFNYQEFLPTGYQKSSDGTIMFKKIENYFEEDSLLQAKKGKLYWHIALYKYWSKENENWYKRLPLTQTSLSECCTAIETTKDDVGAKDNQLVDIHSHPYAKGTKAANDFAKGKIRWLLFQLESKI